MIRAFSWLLMAGGLVACQAPPPVRDMSGLVAKFTAQMDSEVGAYVGALNDNNASDAPRLERIASLAVRTGAANSDDLAIWNLASGRRASNVSRILEAVSAMSVNDRNPLTGSGLLLGSAAMPSAPKITFDDTPLKTIGTVAGNIATPKSRAEQLKVFGAYAKQVQADMRQDAKKLGAGH